MTAPPGPRIFFDCDDTLLTWNWRLRPHTHDVLRRLVEHGCQVYLWSGLGERWDIVKRFDLAPLLSGVYAKPLYRCRERLAELKVPFAPDYVVDDHPLIVETFGGWLIPPPVEPLEDDTHLLAALADIERCFALLPKRGEC